MSSEVDVQDSQVYRSLTVLTTVLFGFFLGMIFLARTIVY